MRLGPIFGLVCLVILSSMIWWIVLRWIGVL